MGREDSKGSYAELYVGDDMGHGAYLVLYGDGTYDMIVNTDNLFFGDDVDMLISKLKNKGFTRLAELLYKTEDEYEDKEIEELMASHDIGYWLSCGGGNA